MPTPQDARRLDGVLPTALQGLQQRRETTRNLQEIDKLLRDDTEEVVLSFGAATKSSRARGCSFGSGRKPTRNSRYWLTKSSSTPGPGAYVASKADSLIKPNVGRGGAIGLRSGVCCRFKPCECKKLQETQVESSVGELNERRQDTKQPRCCSPHLVAYSRPSSTEPDFQTLEQQRRIAAVQAAKQWWKHLGLNTTPNYRWTERRAGTGGALPMSKITSRDGVGSSTAKTILRKLLITDRKSHKCEVGTSRDVKITAASVEQTRGAVDMAKLSGRDTVHCKRKHQRVVAAF